MYIMMCEIREHSNPYNIELDEVTLLSAHPIDAVETADDRTAWMVREPEIIVGHLNLVTDDEWELGIDRNENHAQIWNKQHTIERMYIARHIG